MNNSKQDNIYINQIIDLGKADMRYSDEYGYTNAQHYNDGATYYNSLSAEEREKIQAHAVRCLSGHTGFANIAKSHVAYGNLGTRPNNEGIANTLQINSYHPSDLYKVLPFSKQTSEFVTKRGVDNLKLFDTSKGRGIVSPQDIDAIGEQEGKSFIVNLMIPTNPYGHVYTPQELKELAAAAKANGAILSIDLICLVFVEKELRKQILETIEGLFADKDLKSYCLSYGKEHQTPGLGNSIMYFSQGFKEDEVQQIQTNAKVNPQAWEESVQINSDKCRSEELDNADLNKWTKEANYTIKSMAEVGIELEDPTVAEKLCGPVLVFDFTEFCRQNNIASDAELTEKLKTEAGVIVDPVSKYDFNHDKSKILVRVFSSHPDIGALAEGVNRIAQFVKERSQQVSEQQMNLNSNDISQQQKSPNISQNMQNNRLSQFGKSNYENRITQSEESIENSKNNIKKLQYNIQIQQAILESEQKSVQKQSPFRK